MQVNEIVPAWANCNGEMMRIEKSSMMLIVR